MVPTAPYDTDLFYFGLDSKFARSEFYAAQQDLHTLARRQHEWEHSRGVWSTVLRQLRSSSSYDFVGQRTDVWRSDSVKASLGICKLWRKGCQCPACREVFVARPLRATRKEIERSVREDLRGIRRLEVGDRAKGILAALQEGDWEPELCSEDVEGSEEKERGDEGLEDLRRNLAPEVPIMELLQPHRRRHQVERAEGVPSPILLGYPRRRFDITAHAPMRSQSPLSASEAWEAVEHVETEFDSLPDSWEICSHGSA
jgi:hypothetical protein